MTLADIHIGKHTLGEGHPVFISAEVGTTCNGDLETSKKLIDAAVDAGMDAVKFQVIDPEDKYSDRSLTYSYTRYNGERATENIYEMLKQYMQPFENWKEISEYATQKGITFFATVDHLAGLEMMEKLDIPAYKVATWDMTFYPLLVAMAKTGKPVILDLGASTLPEIAWAIDIFKAHGNEKLILLHCYHTDQFDQMNLKTIDFLRDTFGYHSGFSTAGRDDDIDLLSLAYSPVYLEKRLTLDRKDPNHHHARAHEPGEMKEFVTRVHQLSQVPGRYTLQPTDGDLKGKLQHFRRIVADKDLPAGHVLTEEDIACRRPYPGGIDAIDYTKVIGQVLRQAVKKNGPITWDMI